MNTVAIRLLGAAAAALLAGNSHAWNEAGGEHEEALKLKPDVSKGMEVYEICSACHLPEGWGLADGTFPQLAGQHRGVLIKQIADIRALNRDNPTMYPFTLPETIGGAQALADVVAYIERLPMHPAWGKGPWGRDSREYAQGEKLYKDNCVQCHGEAGLGDAAKLYPRINGQHYNYTVRQFQWIRDGKRRNSNPEMVKQIESFTDKEMQLVNNYASWQPVPQEHLAKSVDWKNPDF